MANLNTSIFSGLRGILRIVTLVIGIICLGIIADKHIKNSKEEFFLAIVIIAFIFSAIWTIILLIGVIADAELVKKIDAFFHLVAGILLFIATIVYFISVADVHDACNKVKVFGWSCSDTDLALRIIAGILGIINGMVYIVLGFFTFTGKG